MGGGARATGRRGRRAAAAMGMKTVSAMGTTSRRRRTRGTMETRAGEGNAEVDASEGSRASSAAARALRPSFLAARRGSRFAHQEFVRLCADAARRGTLTVGDARVEAALMGLSAEARMGQSEQDAFASAVAMVILTLRRFDDAFDASAEIDPEARGMLKYIEMTNKNADEGHTLRRMELERRFLNPESARRAPAPHETIMRMNCKLTLLTREMIEHERGITSARRELEALSASVSTDETEVIEIETKQQLALGWCTRERTPARALASDMLVAFFSVLTGHPVGYRAFVRAARTAYESGISADEITAALDGAELDVEGTRRGMFGRASDAPKLFAGFVSTAYVAFEAQGLPLPPAANGDEDLYAYANYPRAIDETGVEREEESDDKKRAFSRGLRQAVELWLTMDREELANQVQASLSMDEGDDDVAKQPFETGSPPPPGDDESFGVVRDDSLSRSSITIETLRNQKNIVSFVRDELARDAR